ncbi:MAG: CRISPR-associated protein Cas4 [bacterium]
MTDKTIALSALQHWLFCPRQCALIHVECLWEENQFTAEGKLLHEQVDKPGNAHRSEVTILRALPLASTSLGITGKADIVEIHDGVPYPVEYKRGRPKKHKADEVQLCAQAICLEEMFDIQLKEGALYYGKTRRRKVVIFDKALRMLTVKVASEASNAIHNGVIPSPIYEERRCNSCSLKKICYPKQLTNPPSISSWMQQQVTLSTEEDI